MAASDHALAAGAARERLTEELVVSIFGRKLPASDRHYATHSVLQHLNRGARSGATAAGPAAAAAAAPPSDPWLGRRALAALGEIAGRLEDACQPRKAAALRALAGRALEGGGEGAPAALALLLALAGRPEASPDDDVLAAPLLAAGSGGSGAAMEGEGSVDGDEEEEEEEGALAVGLRRRRRRQPSSTTTRRRRDQESAENAPPYGSPPLSDWGDDDDEGKEQQQQEQQAPLFPAASAGGWRLGAQGGTETATPPVCPLPLRPVPEMRARRLPLGRLERRPPLPIAAAAPGSSSADKLARGSAAAVAGTALSSAPASPPPPENATLLEALLAARLGARAHAPLPEAARCLAPSELAQQALRAARADVPAPEEGSGGAFLLVACGGGDGADANAAAAVAAALPATAAAAAAAAAMMIAVDRRCLTPSLSQGALHGLLAGFAEAGTAFRALDAAARRLSASQLEPRCPWTAFRGAADEKSKDGGAAAWAGAAENGAWWRPPRAAVALARPLPLPAAATPCLTAFGEALGQQLDALRRQLAALEALPGARKGAGGNDNDEGDDGDDDDDDEDDDAAASSSAAPLLEVHRLAQGTLARVRLLHSVTSHALERAAEAAEAAAATAAAASFSSSSAAATAAASRAAASAALIDALDAQLRRAASVTGPEGEGRRRCLAHLLMRACLPMVGSLGRWLWGGRAEEDDAALLFFGGGGGGGGGGVGGDFFVVPVGSSYSSSSLAPSSSSRVFRTRAFGLAGAEARAAAARGGGAAGGGDGDNPLPRPPPPPSCCPAFLAPLAEDILDAGRSLRLLRYLQEQEQQQGQRSYGRGHDDAARAADQGAAADDSGEDNDDDDGIDGSGATAAAALQRAFVSSALEVLGLGGVSGRAAGGGAEPPQSSLGGAMACAGRLAAAPERCAEAEAEAAPARGWREQEEQAEEDWVAQTDEQQQQQQQMQQMQERQKPKPKQQRPFPPSFDAAVRATSGGAAARRLDDALLLQLLRPGASSSLIPSRSRGESAAAAAAAPGLLRRALVPGLRRRCGSVRAALVRRLVFGGSGGLANADAAGPGSLTQASFSRASSAGLAHELEAVRNAYFLSAPALAAWADEQLLPALEAAAAAGVVSGRRRRQVSEALSAPLLLESREEEQAGGGDGGASAAAPSALELVDVGQLQRALDAALEGGGDGGPRGWRGGAQHSPPAQLPLRDALPPPGSLHLHLDRGALARARAHQDQALARAMAERRKAAGANMGAGAPPLPLLLLPPLPPPPISSLELEALSFRLRCGGGQQQLSLLPLVIQGHDGEEEDEREDGGGFGRGAGLRSSSSSSSSPSRLDPCLRLLLQLRLARRAVGAARLAAIKRRDACADLERREAVERAGAALAAEQRAAESRAAAGGGGSDDGPAGGAGIPPTPTPLLSVRDEAAALQAMAQLLAALHACVMDGLVAPAAGGGPDYSPSCRLGCGGGGALLLSAWAALERDLSRARSLGGLRAAHRAFLDAALRQCCRPGADAPASSSSSASSAAAWRHVGATLPRLFDAALSFAAAHADLLDARSEADRRVAARHARNLLPPAALPLSARRALRLAPAVAATADAAYGQEDDDDDDYADGVAARLDDGGCWRPSDAPASLAAARAAACIFAALPPELAVAAAPAEAWRAVERHRRALAAAAAHWREGVGYLRRVLRVQQQQQQQQATGGEGDDDGGDGAAAAWPPLRDLLLALGAGGG